MSAPATFDAREEPLIAVYMLALALARMFDDAIERERALTADDIGSGRIGTEAMLWAIEAIEGVQDRSVALDIPFAKWRAAELLQVELRNTKGHN